MKVNGVQLSRVARKSALRALLIRWSTVGQLSAASAAVECTTLTDEHSSCSESISARLGRERGLLYAVYRRYTDRRPVIKSFRHGGIEPVLPNRQGGRYPTQAREAPALAVSGTQSGTGAERHERALRLHPLKGRLAGHWAVWVDENWRLTFAFEGTDAVLVDYRDYH